MLVLSRQRDETIMIGDEIEITVVDIRGDKVRLGITAPTRIAVHRKEVYEAIRVENEQASRLAGSSLPDGGGISPGPAKLRVNAKTSRLAATTAPINPPGSSLRATLPLNGSPTPSANSPTNPIRGLAQG
jgi:carbon storage regulator